VLTLVRRNRHTQSYRGVYGISASRAEARLLAQISDIVEDVGAVLTISLLDTYILPAMAARNSPVYAATTRRTSSALKANAVSRSNGRVTQQRTNRTNPNTSDIANKGKTTLARSIEWCRVGVISR
jgi:hypothetical protein